MKKTINNCEFVEMFDKYGRSDNFSRLGRRKLAEYFEQLEEDLGQDIEVDVIAICCDYSEIEIKDIERETGCENLEDLQDNTTVIEVDDETIIYQNF